MPSELWIFGFYSCIVFSPGVLCSLQDYQVCLLPTNRLECPSNRKIHASESYLESLESLDTLIWNLHFHSFPIYLTFHFLLEMTIASMLSFKKNMARPTKRRPWFGCALLSRAPRWCWGKDQTCDQVKKLLKKCLGSDEVPADEELMVLLKVCFRGLRIRPKRFVAFGWFKDYK